MRQPVVHHNEVSTGYLSPTRRHSDSSSYQLPVGLMAFQPEQRLRQTGTILVTDGRLT
jgi:hypothetical protein